MATTFSSWSASGGSGPKRSISSAASASRSCGLLGVRQAAIERQAHVEVGHVVLGISTAAPVLICGDQPRSLVQRPRAGAISSSVTASSSICW